MAENTPDTALSIDEAVVKLRESREDQSSQAQPEEDTEAKTEEVHEDQAEEEVEVESEPEVEESEDEPEDESEDDDGLYEVGGEQFTLSELREWKANGLRQSDYTRKTQEIAEARKGFEVERAQWETERETVAEQITQQQAQLKDALATFVVDQDPEPSPEGLTWEDFTKRKSAWDKRQTKKAQAREVFRNLQEQQQQEVIKRETALLVRHFPAWRDPAVFQADAKAMVTVAGDYGFTPEQIAGITDHRMLRVLSELASLKSVTDKNKANRASAATKVAVAAKRLTPGSKINSKNQVSKELRHKQDQLRKTGSINDAVAVLQARRKAN